MIAAGTRIFGNVKPDTVKTEMAIDNKTSSSIED
jgi:hypothetical protein